MVGWVAPLSPMSGQDKDDLAANWEWMLSTAEDVALKQSKLQAADLQSELERIRRLSGTVQYRPKIASLVKDDMSKLSLESQRILVESRLDASKRDRLIRDALRRVSDGWLEIISSWLPEDAGLAGRWQEQTYKKNIMGEMASMAFYASHPAGLQGLTSSIMSDLMWSIYICLSREISPTLDEDRATQSLGTAKSSQWDDLDRAHRLIELIMPLTGDIIELWLSTTKAVGSVAQREGRLQERWAEEDKKDKTREILGRFNDGPSQPFVKGESLTSDYQQRRASLSTSLCMRRPM